MVYYKMYAQAKVIVQLSLINSWNNFMTSGCKYIYIFFFFTCNFIRYKFMTAMKQYYISMDAKDIIIKYNNTTTKYMYTMYNY